MRTKTLLLAVATLAASLGVSSAQTVYSQNVVGYINQVIPPGFSMIANQLDYDGTGTNNTLRNLLPAPPNGTIVYKFTGTGYTSDNYAGGWTDPTLTLNPGEGVFIFNPTLSPMTNAFIGTVFQGTNNAPVPAGYSLQGYTVPVAGKITTDFKYPVANGDSILLWNASSNAFDAYNYLGGWAPVEPTISVGQSFFINRGVTTNWVISFTVQ